MSMNKSMRGILAILMICMSCTFGCSRNDTTESSQIPSDTSAAQTKESSTGNITTSNSTSEPTSSAILSREIIASLGTGIRAEVLFAKVGLQAVEIIPGHYRFSIANDPTKLCDILIVDYFGSPVIQSGSILEKGTSRELFKPVPDVNTIDDSQFIINGKSVSAIHAIGEDELFSILGEPESQEITTVSAGDGMGKYKVNKLIYPGLLITWRQPEDTENTSQWFIIQITSTDSRFSTPRGLVVGMQYTEVMRLLGTGDFLLLPDDLPFPANMEVEKMDEANTGEFYVMNLQFNEGKLSAITISFTGP